MQNISRIDSAFTPLLSKEEPTDLLGEAGVLIRPLRGRQVLQAIKDTNAEVVDSYGAEHDLFKDGMRAGLLSRTFRRVGRIGDNQFGIVHDQHTLRDGLVPTGAYCKNALNPYAQRDWYSGAHMAHQSFAINQGRFLSEHLEHGESCIVKLPSGRCIAIDESFLAFSLGAPVLVGTHFYKGPRGGAAACLKGSKFTELSVAGVEAGRYWRLGADTAAIVEEDGRMVRHGPNSQFQVGPTARVVTCLIDSERLVIDGLKIALADGEMRFSSLCEARVTAPDTFLGKQAGSPRQFVENQLHYALEALLSGTLALDWFTSLAHAQPDDGPSKLQRVMGDAVTRVTHACTRAGITLEQLSITPQWTGKFAEGVDAISGEKIAATVKAVTEEARKVKHPYDRLEAQRGLEIDAIEAQKTSHRERLRLLEALLANRSFDRAL